MDGADEDGADEDEDAGRILMILASFAPLTTGPPTSTESPVVTADSATCLRSDRTLVAEVRSQDQVVPSAALTVITDALTACTVPRSNAMVFVPVLALNVTWPYSPRTSASRSSGRRQMALTRAAAVFWPADCSADSILAQRPAAADAVCAVVAAVPPEPDVVEADAPPVRATPMPAPPPSRIALAPIVVTSLLVRPDRDEAAGAGSGSAGPRFMVSMALSFAADDG